MKRKNNMVSLLILFIWIPLLAEKTKQPTQKEMPDKAAIVLEKETQKQPKKKETGVQKNKEPKKRTIKVCNNINRKMRAKRYMFKDYHPHQFHVKVAGKPLGYGKKCEVEIKNDELMIAFDFEFKIAHVHKTGNREVRYKIPEDLSEVALNFSWEDERRIQINKAIFLTYNELD